jgi:hypothetical protein
VPSLKKPQLSAEAIIARYNAGESASELALRAKIPYPRLSALLDAHGVKRRSSQEGLAIWHRRRRAKLGLAP